MNSISPPLETGTIGELLVQLRLLQFGVQAAPPLKDSGNDLIAIKGDVFRAIQVKTTATGNIERPDFNKKWHIYIFVLLSFSGSDVSLDRTRIKVLSCPGGDNLPRNWRQTCLRELDAEVVSGLWS